MSSALLALLARLATVPEVVAATIRARYPPRIRRADEGQATVEYALVVLAAATVALLLVAWAARTGRVTDLFERVFDRATAAAG